MTVKRGALIVIEGVDRTGKSTQCRKLVENLNKKQIPAEYTNFPDRTTEVGKVINSYLCSKKDLPDEAIHLLFSANRWEKVETIKELLKKGISVIVDRYCYSGAAFSAAKGLDMNWCKSPDIGLPKPDRVFFLTMPPEEVEQRKGFGSERYEVLEFQKKVLNMYMQLKDESWEILDATRSIAAIQEELLNKSLTIVDSVGFSPVNKLWVDENQ
ncbi:uncharacterized protein [Epargyreus clarus]|uniref:uncharacterized protein n=1 Tax=Epargyreus clarus TaxID=520877 RepID=UPI003C300657